MVTKKKGTNVFRTKIQLLLETDTVAILTKLTSRQPNTRLDAKMYVTNKSFNVLFMCSSNLYSMLLQRLALIQRRSNRRSTILIDMKLVYMSFYAC